MGQRERIVEIAKSQVGYTEGNNNWTKYGEWYGMQDEWCDIFISWCSHEAGISTDIIPKEAYVPATANWFDARHLYKNAESWGGHYVPVKGDLILFDWDRTSISDHIGIIEDVNGRRIYTIEGNRENKVKRCEYDLYDVRIRAYCTPKYIDDGEGDDMRIYKNGSTREPVYSDTNLTHQIGSLNPRETCDCYGIFENRAVVRYKIDNSDNFKIGFVEWTGGVV